MKTNALAALATTILISNPAFSQDNSITPHSGDNETALTAIQFMNYLRYVSYEISEYQNVFVIEDEYRNLSSDNLNLGRIPDEQITQSIRDHLQTLFELRMEDKKRERFLSELQKKKARRRQDRFVHLIWGSRNKESDNIDEFVDDFSDTPTAVARQAKDISNSAVSLYDDYVTFQREIEDADEKFSFKFDVARMKRLHENNLKNFDFTLDLIRRYGIEDQMRLTENDAKTLVSCVKSSDKTSVFSQLKVMAKYRTSFTHFPFFWCQYASFAVASGHPNEAIEACNHFEQENRFSLFQEKDDRLAAQTAMAKVQAMLDLGKTNETDQVQIKNALIKITKYNSDGHDYDMAYYCALIAHSVLHDEEFALDILNGLIGKQVQQSSEELVKYRDLFTKPKEDQKFEPVPLLADLLRCIALRTSIEKDEKNDSFREELSAIFGATVVQGVEKLFFVGSSRKKDLFEKAKSVIAAIRLQYEPGLFSKDAYHALVPAAWFVLGDFPVSLDLFRGMKKLETIKDDSESRFVIFDRHISQGALVKVKLPRQSYLDTRTGIDGFRLNIPNPSWPVSILYVPNGNSNELTPVSVTFLGAEFPIADLEAAKKATMEKLAHSAKKATKDANSYSVAIPFPETETEINIHGLCAAQFENNSLVVACRNPEDYVGSYSISAKLYNEFGAELCSADGSAELPSGASGSIRLNLPAEMNEARNPAFVFFSCRLKEKKKGWGIF